jgi:O-antigen/teichoic acid export membrane protein
MKAYITVFFERFSIIGINFLTIIVLSRFLEPRDFGLIAIINAVLGLSSVLVDSGLGGSLIYHKTKKTDFNTVFTSNLIASFFIFFIIVILTPLISMVYEADEIVSLLIVSSTIIIIRAYSLTAMVSLTKEGRFLTQLKINIAGGSIGLCVAILTVYKGAGVWSLVYQQLVSNIVITLLFNKVVAYKPEIFFNKSLFLKHFKYGYKLTLSSIFKNAYIYLQPLILGFSNNVASVGYFSQATKINNLNSSLTYSIVDKVSFPILSKIKNSNEFLEKSLKIFYCSMLFSLISSIFIYFNARLVVRIVFGPNWDEVIILLKILVLSGPFLMLESLNRTFLKSCGKASELLRIELIKRPLSIAILLLSSFFGDLLYFTYAILGCSIICSLCNIYVVSSLTPIGWAVQLKAIFKIFMCLIMCFLSTLFIKTISGL